MTQTSSQAYQRLKQSLIDIHAIQRGQFQLKSGEFSEVYVDLRRLISYPTLLREAARVMWAEFSNSLSYEKPQLLCGVPYGALPITTCMALDQDVPLIMARKEKKSHGLGHLIEGNYQDGQRCLVVEDVITSGGSVLETIKKLEAVGLVVQDILVLLDREQGAQLAFERAGYRLHRVLSFKQLVE